MSPGGITSFQSKMKLRKKKKTMQVARSLQMENGRPLIDKES
jgi:hypothetical protein